MRSRAVMEKPYPGRVRFRNRSWSAYHRMFRGRNNEVTLLNFIVNGFFHQQFNGGISSRCIIAHMYFGELCVGVHQLKAVNNASAKNASSSSPASSCSQSFMLSGEFRKASQFCVAGLVCCCSADCATWTKPEWLRPQAFPPDTQQLHTCSYTQLWKLQPLELLKLRKIVRPSLVKGRRPEVGEGLVEIGSKIIED